jgi:hypothetical protein
MYKNIKKTALFGTFFSFIFLFSFSIIPSPAKADFWDDINPLKQIGNIISGKPPIAGIPPVLVPGGQLIPLPGAIGTPTLPNLNDLISPPLVPTIRDVHIDQLTCTQVRLNAYIGTQGTPDTVAFFEWGVSPSLGKTTTSQIIPTVAANIDQTLTATKDGLLASTTYYYRARAKNSLFDEKGDINSFIFPRCPSIASITSSSTFPTPPANSNNGGGIPSTVTSPPANNNNGGGSTLASTPTPSPVVAQTSNGGPVGGGGWNQPTVSLLHSQYISGAGSSTPSSQQLASLHISLTSIPYTGDEGLSAESWMLIVLVGISLFGAIGARMILR